jgi:DNA processing protein
MFEARSIAPKELEFLPAGREVDVCGSIPPTPRLAVVGSRSAMRSSIAATSAIIAAAGARQWAIVSGGARGIDKAAHRAALRHRVPQLAVLPLGCDQPYPADHRGLFDEIVAAEQSGLLFAQKRGAVATRGMFASRNRLVVQLSAAVVVVQAALHSGSVMTGRLALRLGVPVAAVAGCPGNDSLLAAGAHAIRSTEIAGQVQDWLDHVRGGVPLRALEWPAELAWLAAAFERSPKGLTLDAFRNPGEAAAALIEACERGLVVEAAPGRYQRVGTRPPAK